MKRSFVITLGVIFALILVSVVVVPQIVSLAKNDCPPSQNDSNGCQHNGGGGGNCGDNQGKGSGGNDNGFGKNGNCGKSSPTPQPKPTNSPVPSTVPPTATPVNPGNRNASATSTFACSLPEGPIALIPQVGTVYEYTVNGQNFLVEAMSGDAQTNHLSLVDNGLCFDLQVANPTIGTVYTYKVTDMSGSIIAVFQSGLITKP